MSFFENTRKPTGLGGRAMVAMMNVGHRALADWGLQFLELSPDAAVLDCGCGGGANIKRLLAQCPRGSVAGVDYAAVSVEKSQAVNRGAIEAGRCRVLRASVAALLPGFCLTGEHSLTEGMAEFVPVYRLLDKIPLVRGISNKIIVLEKR